MPKITYVFADGREEAVDAPAGTNIMQAAVNAGLDGIVAECGGNAMCATCHVYVDNEHSGALPPLSMVEDELLECTASPREPGSRLSCQLPIVAELDGIRVRLPEEQQ